VVWRRTLSAIAPYRVGYWPPPHRDQLPNTANSASDRKSVGDETRIKLDTRRLTRACSYLVDDPGALSAKRSYPVGMRLCGKQPEQREDRWRWATGRGVQCSRYTLSSIHYTPNIQIEPVCDSSCGGGVRERSGSIAADRHLALSYAGPVTSLRAETIEFPLGRTIRGSASYGPTMPPRRGKLGSNTVTMRRMTLVREILERPSIGFRHPKRLKAASPGGRRCRLYYTTSDKTPKVANKTERKGPHST
jgi:hypothetical protein